MKRYKSPWTCTRDPYPTVIEMEGILWKWTNYVSGWQQRWFVLNSGVLAYYISQNEVSQGCKGSLKVASCDITVHPHDPLRLDIVIPGERHLYLRAPSNSERQEWLVALGSMKQEELSSFVSEKKRTDALTSKMVELHLNCQLLTNQLAVIKSTMAHPQSLPDANKLQEMSLQISSTCDRFLNSLAECMDLTFDVRWPADLKPLVSKRHGKNSPSIDHSPLLGAGKGDLFLLPPDMKSSPSTHCLKEARVPPQTFQQQQLCSQSSFPSHILQGSTHHKDGSSPHKESHTHHPEGSSSFASPIITSCDGPHLLEGRSTERNEGREVEPHPGHTQPGQRMNTPASLKEGGGVSLDSHPKDKTTTPKDDPSISAAMTGLSSGPSRHNAGSQADQFHTPKSSPPSTPRPSPPPTPQPPPTIGCIVKCPPRINGVQTFFSLVSHRFEDLVLIEESGIPTSPFLECCRDVIPFFDTLNSTAFAPVKADIGGNIEKLAKKYTTNPQLFATLQSMVLHELKNNTHNEKNSATDALLWLKRAMEFIQVFIDEVAKGEQSLDTAAGTAYGKTLRRFHNWIVRGIFSLAVKAVPYHQDFMNILGSDGSVQANEFVIQDMKTFAASLGYLVRLIGTFYVDHKLEALPSTD